MPIAKLTGKIMASLIKQKYSQCPKTFNKCIKA